MGLVREFALEVVAADLQPQPVARGQDALAAVRARVEHGFACLKNWRVLGEIRTDPRWATALVRALLVLTNREVSR
ncbi:hypothetical protein [Streptomyces sp. 5-10]|uniref:hypothetical protein n=1 Tax=Streptomyces sp. 5-10 TaxID=878925 RepID=UPI001CC30CBA